MVQAFTIYIFFQTNIRSHIQRKLFRNKTIPASKAINNTVMSRDLSVNVRVNIFDLCCRRFQWCESNSKLEQISVANPPIGSQNCFAEFAMLFRYNLEVGVNYTNCIGVEAIISPINVVVILTIAFPWQNLYLAVLKDYKLLTEYLTAPLCQI